MNEQTTHNSASDHRGIALDHRFPDDDPLMNLVFMIERAETVAKALEETSDPHIDNLAGRLSFVLLNEISDIRELVSVIQSTNGGAS